MKKRELRIDVWGLTKNPIGYRMPFPPGWPSSRKDDAKIYRSLLLMAHGAYYSALMRGVDLDDHRRVRAMALRIAATRRQWFWDHRDAVYDEQGRREARAMARKKKCTLRP